MRRARYCRIERRAAVLAPLGSLLLPQIAEACECNLEPRHTPATERSRHSHRRPRSLPLCRVRRELALIESTRKIGGWVDDVERVSGPCSMACPRPDVR